jgi:hypothetical protein
MRVVPIAEGQRVTVLVLVSELQYFWFVSGHVYRELFPGNVA